MGGVDLLDQMVVYVGGERPFHKFWKKVFFFSSSTEWHFVHTHCISKTPQPNGNSHISGLCATPVDQPLAILIPLRQANLVHTAVLLPGKKEKDCIVCSDP